MNLKNERLVLLLLAAIQFTTNLDFLIILPLGPQYMRVMHITPAQFNTIVASYAIAAGLSGIIAGFFLDRFDRRKALLWLFLGFAAGTLCCARWLRLMGCWVAARAVAGMFGGVTGAVILAIVGDVIPENRRGEAMLGLVMSAFSGGVHFWRAVVLVLASKFNWHVPFYAIAGICVPISLLSRASCQRCADIWNMRWSNIPPRECWPVLAEPNHQMAFIFMSVLTCAGFVIFPTLATYMVYNVGLTEQQLPFIYLTGGLCTLFSMNWIGRWADRAGKLRVFTIMSLTASVPILALTNASACAARFGALRVNVADDLHVGPFRPCDGDDDEHRGIALSRRIHERELFRATILLRPGRVDQRRNHRSGTEPGNYALSSGWSGFAGLCAGVHLAGALSSSCFRRIVPGAGIC